MEQDEQLSKKDIQASSLYASNAPMVKNNEGEFFGKQEVGQQEELDPIEEEEQPRIQQRRHRDKGLEPAEEEEVYFDDINSLRRTHRLVNNMEGKQQLSGCLFGCVGLIVLGFAVFLINRGVTSRRFEEINEYVDDVKAWKTQYAAQFSQLTFGVQSSAGDKVSTNIPMQQGKPTSEIDVRYALGMEEMSNYRAERRKRYRDKKEQDFDGARRSLKDLTEITKDEIQYTPYRYNSTFTPTRETAFIPTVFTTSAKHRANITLSVNDANPDSDYAEYALISRNFSVIYKREFFSKNADKCHHGNGLRSNTHNCIYYHKISKVCLLVDYVPITGESLEKLQWPEPVVKEPEETPQNAEESGDPDNQSQGENTDNQPQEENGGGTRRNLEFEEGKKAWQITGTCGVEHTEQLADSREFQQEIGFFGYPFTVEIRSAKDPHVRFGGNTKGLFVLDESPSGQIAAGVLLLIFGTAMLLMSAYKTYRFCIKYTCRDYLRKRRQRQYMSRQDDSEEMEIQGKKKKKATDEESKQK